MLEIDCAGELLRLLPDKAVYWPAASTLVLADLHLGKPATFRAAGIPVPESTTLADLARLQDLIRTLRPRRLMILGDLFHARAGLQREMLDAVDQWREKNPGLEIILVSGNHDRRAGKPPANWDFEVVSRWSEGPFLFVHEPVEKKSAYVLAGHIHPALVMRDKFGPALRAACFCFGERRAILPAFGSFTGMCNIQPARGERIFLIGDRRVIQI